MSAALVVLSLLLAQQQGGRGRVSISLPPEPEAAKVEAPKPLEEEKPVVTKHEIHVHGQTLSYTATAGMMPMKDAKGQMEANLFYVAYTLDGVSDLTKRPLMFAFNGGPGSASVWLHMGCIGPKRVKMNDDGGLPARALSTGGQRQTPGSIRSDLVFVDPVGTGYSRAVNETAPAPDERIAGGHRISRRIHPPVSIENMNAGPRRYSWLAKVTAPRAPQAFRAI